MDLRIATATADDLPAIAIADGRAFGIHHTDPELTDELALVDPTRFLLARDGDDVAGVTGDFPFHVTVPGGASLEIPGVSWVSVAPTHRRRGVLRSLMWTQHRRFLDAGMAISALIATEGGIYGRFGYGPATVDRSVEIDRTRVQFRADTPDPGGVWLAEAGEALAHAPAVHERWRRRVPGALSRSAARWDLLLRDREPQRGGSSALFFLLHPDGFASYRIDRARHRCRVVDLVAVTEDAYAALWRILVGLDLVTTVSSRRRPPDDPLPFLLTDPRLVRTTDARDGMWVRLLDVPGALAARTYRVELDTVLEVTDSSSTVAAGSGCAAGLTARNASRPIGRQTSAPMSPPSARSTSAVTGPRRWPEQDGCRWAARQGCGSSTPHCTPSARRTTAPTSERRGVPGPGWRVRLQR